MCDFKKLLYYTVACSSEPLIIRCCALLCSMLHFLRGSSMFPTKNASMSSCFGLLPKGLFDIFCVPNIFDHRQIVKA